MSFRRRVIVLSGLAVAMVSIVTYLLVRDELRGRVDAELKRDVSETFASPVVSSSDPPRLSIGRSATDRGHAALSPVEDAGSSRRAGRLFLPSGPLGGRSVYAQVVESDGRVIRPSGALTRLPGRRAARAVAAGDRDAFFSDTETAGAHLRVYTAQIERGTSIQVARALDEVDTPSTSSR